MTQNLPSAGKPQPLGSGRWVRCSERCPGLEVEVRVHGRHTPNGSPKPVACRKRGARGIDWQSPDWRGMVGITHWWEAAA